MNWRSPSSTSTPSRADNRYETMGIHPIIRSAAIARIAPVLFIPSFLFLSCSRGGAPSGQVDEAAHAGHGPEVALTPEQVKAIGLVTGTLEQRGLRTALKANGRLVLPPDKNAQVSVLIGGLVKDVAVQEGVHVEKGQVLATLENLEFLQLQQDYLETAAGLKATEADLRRQRELQADRINAARTLERVEADVAAAQVRLAAMASKLRLFGIDPARLSPGAIGASFAVRAPIAGNLKHIGVTLGQYAEPNKPLFEVVDNRGLHIDLNVFEQDVARVRVGQKVAFGHAGEPVGQHTATIFAINKAFESDQQAVLVHAKLDDNGEELLPGMFIEALIGVDSTQAQSLPSEAVVSNGDDHYVYVEHEANTFVQVPVRTGTSELGYTEVVPLEPIAPGARVVIKGAYYLLSEQTKGEGGHAH